MGFELPLWRGILVFRLASIVYAVGIVVQQHERLLHPWAAWAVLAAMGMWTAATGYLYPRLDNEAKRRAMCWADLLVSFACMMSTILVATPSYLRMAPPMTATWFAGAALAATVIRGRGWALGIALLYGVADNVIRLVLGMDVSAATARGVILLLLAGLAVGFMVHVAHEAEERIARAVEIEARTRERERLSRSIHDSVLQVLAMVQRRGAEAGGEAAELGRLAGEQEAKLRSLIGVDGTADRGDAPPTGAHAGALMAARRAVGLGGRRTGAGTGGAGGEPTDLRPLLGVHASRTVTVSNPATEVLLPAGAAAEVDAAVGAALSNVERHAGPDVRAWVLVEDEGGAVTVTVRDDGPGMPAERVGAAESAGRLGIAQSIKGRIRDLGGSVEITSAPGEGVEIEMRVPN